MKKPPLAKRRLWGLPLWLVVALLFSSLASAYLVYFLVRTTIVREPIQVAEGELRPAMFPGEANAYFIYVRNEADLGYNLKYVIKTMAPEGVSFAFDLDTGLGYQPYAIVEVKLLPSGWLRYKGAEIPIPPLGNQTLRITVNSLHSSAVGNVSIEVEVEREKP